eukprot:scaffold69083_cov19-Tisochrysis_lutea.AAC.1
MSLILLLARYRWVRLCKAEMPCVFSSRLSYKYLQANGEGGLGKKLQCTLGSACGRESNTGGHVQAGPHPNYLQQAAHRVSSL